MNFEIKEKKENSLLERTEVDAIVSFDGPTPSIQQMRDIVVQKLGCNPDLTVIRKVESSFGMQQVSVRVHIYKSPEKMKTIEEAFVLKRNNLAEEEKKEAKPAEAPAEKKEEAPKEEKKEEPKAEEKKEEKKEEKPEEKKEEPKPEEKKEAPKEEPKAEEKKEEPAEEKKEE